jgi:chromosomal replication initiator protein
MNNQQIWQAILGHLEVSLSKANFNTWLKNTHISDKTEDTITVAVPSTYHKDWISSKYNAEMLKALKGIAPEIKAIKYQVGGTAKPQPVLVAQTEQESPSSTSNNSFQAPQQQQINQNPNINQKYVFDSFIIGKNNELAHAASLAVAKNPGTQYNPLFIYGGVGLGKTHLMHAVANRLLHENPRAKVLYLTSEKFTNDYINAISTKKMDDFKQHYRTVDMLLIDDIQFIAGKEGTQEEFFHTFNELRDKGKQIIITADRLPKEIPSIEQRLVSRFEWGMVADIQPPDLETRMAILRTKLARRGTSLPDEVVIYIAENVQNNVRELEGALNRLLVYQDMENHEVTLEQAQTMLQGMMNNKKKGVTVKKIVSLIAEFYNVTSEDLIKQSRKQEFVKPRQIAMYVVRQELATSFPSIGDFFGGRDHTTVMHAVEKVQGMLSEKESFKQELDLILDKLYAS